MRLQRPMKTATQLLVAAVLLLLLLLPTTASFGLGVRRAAVSRRHLDASALSNTGLPQSRARSRTIRLDAADGNEDNGRTATKKKKPHRSGRRNNRRMTLAELRDQVVRNPAKFSEQPTPKPKNTRRRTRRRVDQPKQQYLYKAQREQLLREGKLIPTKPPDASSGDDAAAEALKAERLRLLQEHDPVYQARQLGLIPSNQHCDAAIDPDVTPRILGQIRVSEDPGSAAHAYIIEKPAGWAILGAGTPTARDNHNNKKRPTGTRSTNSSSSSSTKNAKSRKRQVENDGNVDTLEFDEASILAMMTPEERAEWEREGAEIFTNHGPVVDTHSDIDDPYHTAILNDFDAISKLSPKEREDAGIGIDDYAADDQLTFSTEDVLAAMTPEERAEMALSDDGNSDTASTKKDKSNTYVHRQMSETTAENLKRIRARQSAHNSRDAVFATVARPSVLGWLKDRKAEEGTPIRGGKFWTAVAGAADVDDTGIVVVCPKASVDNLFIDFATYVAVAGNGKFLASEKTKSATKTVVVPPELVQLESVAKVRKGRIDDVVQTVEVTVNEHRSTCSSVVSHIQDQVNDGVRGDPEANPLDRRAPRRLIHCRSIGVSSLIADEDIQVDLESVAEDIRIFASRRNEHEYRHGSFLGRGSLRSNNATTAYREINGAADGFPGWTVDRYDRWLLVQHDEREYRGPLPSIHDGNTVGVYYLPASPDRSSMGSVQNVRPRLIEGKAAPDFLTIKENGVKYMVSLDKDLSTGIFLDQRPHRGWLTRHCTRDTRVLNCFAHCGAFSVAAATAGASTVSLDLSKKWLDRIQPQLEMNGVEFDERHDCIYGDCFEWLEKLSKRNEKFDVVIVDPPSSSVGKKKRRWSVRNDMAELVALAAPLVKKGGLLWTTTNSASMTPLKFARECRKGLDSVGLRSSRLERVQAMPEDFPTIGPQPVKNLVWRIK